MTTNAPCSNSVLIPRRVGTGAGMVIAGALLIVSTGCGPTAGAWMYTFGMVPKDKVEAEFQLPPGPTMVLVDDYQDLIQPAHARFMLVDEVAKRLMKQKITDEARVRQEIAEGLSTFDDAKAVQFLMRDALRDRSERVREIVAMALGGIGHEEAVEPLVKAIGDRSLAVRQRRR